MSSGTLNLQHLLPEGSVELVPQQTVPQQQQQQADKRKPDNAATKSDDEEESRRQLLKSLSTTTSALPESLINTLLNDLDGGRGMYRRIADPSQLDARPPNASYIQMKFACCCSDGVLVPSGQLGKLREDDNFVFLQPGYHKFTTHGSSFEGCVPMLLPDQAQVFGSAGFVTISEGHIGVMLVGPAYRLLAPGLYQWNSPSITFLRSVDITRGVVARLGPFALVTVPEGEVAITFNNGNLRVLGMTRPNTAAETATMTPAKQLDPSALAKFESASSFVAGSQSAAAAAAAKSDKPSPFAALESEVTAGRMPLPHSIGNNDSFGPFKPSALAALPPGEFSREVSVESRGLPSPSAVGIDRATFALSVQQQYNPMLVYGGANSSVTPPHHQQQQGNNNQASSSSSSRIFFLDDPRWVFVTTLSMKTQVDKLEEIDVLTADNVEMVLTAMTEYRIVAPERVITMLGDDMDMVRHKVKQLVRATVARIIAATKVGAGHDIPHHKQKHDDDHGLHHQSNSPQNEQQPQQSQQPVTVTNPLLHREGTASADEIEAAIKKQHQKAGIVLDDSEEFLPPVRNNTTTTTTAGGAAATAAATVSASEPLAFFEQEQQQQQPEQKADLAHLMSSGPALAHYRTLQNLLFAVGISVSLVAVPEKRMKNHDIRREIAQQAVVGIHAEAERSAADASAYATIKQAQAEAEAIREVARAHAAAGLKLGHPCGTAARMALSEITAKALANAEVTIFTGAPETMPYMFTAPTNSLSSSGRVMAIEE